MLPLKGQLLTKQKSPRSCADPVNGRKPKCKEEPDMNLVPQATEFSKNEGADVYS